MPPASGWYSGALGPRVDPDDAERQPGQPLHLAPHQGRVAGVPAVGDDHDDRAPGQPAPAVVVVELLQRGADPGPAQPVRRRLPGPLQRRPGCTCASALVSRVSRVANRTPRPRAPPAAQYSNCSMARAYGSIEPEMSHSTTSCRGRRAGVRLMSRERVPTGPPCLAQRGPQIGAAARAAAARGRRDRRIGTASVSLRISPASSSQLVRRELGEIRRRQPLDRAGHHPGRPGASPSAASSLAPASPSLARASPSSTRGAGAASGAPGMSADACSLAARAARASVPALSPSRRSTEDWCSPDAGKLRRSWKAAAARPPAAFPVPFAPVGNTLLAPPNVSPNTRSSVSACSRLDTSVASAHRYSSRRLRGRATVTARANRSHRPGPTGTPAPRSAAPNRAATWATSLSHRASSPGALEEFSRRRARPRTRPPGPTCRSSAYFSTAPAVCSAAASSSSVAPSTCSAPAQLIASATPGGLARSRSAQPGHAPRDLAGQRAAARRHPAPDDRRHPARCPGSRSSGTGSGA